MKNRRMKVGADKKHQLLDEKEMPKGELTTGSLIATIFFWGIKIDANLIMVILRDFPSNSAFCFVWVSK